MATSPCHQSFPLCPYGCNVNQTLALHNLINSLFSPLLVFLHGFVIREEAGMDWGTRIELRIPVLANRTNLPKSSKWNGFSSFTVVILGLGDAAGPAHCPPSVLCWLIQVWQKYLELSEREKYLFFLTKEEAQSYVWSSHWNRTSQTVRKCFSEKKLSLLHKTCRYISVQWRNWVGTKQMTLLEKLQVTHTSSRAELVETRTSVFPFLPRAVWEHWDYLSLL